MFFLPYRNSSQKGQAILVVLLVMAVIFTLGLSAASRSVTDISISRQSQESARAFWAAQAGLEKALLGQGSTEGILEDATYKVTKTVFGASDSFVFPEKVSSGEILTYWLVGHDDLGQIDFSDFYGGDSLALYWGDKGTPSDSDTTPALAINLIYQDTGGNYRSAKFAYDPHSGRSPATNFSSLVSGSDFEPDIFAFKATVGNLSSLPFFSKPVYINIELLFNNVPQSVGVKTSEGFSQGSCYESEAKIASSNVTRKLQECRGWSKLPEIFNSLLFSGTSLTK